MGNCQAADAAALVIQHPSGRTERMYWPVTASEVMKLNPGHYVSLVVPVLPISRAETSDDKTTARFTRVMLLRPTDTLVLGRAYRLIKSQEVMKVLRAKKYAKMKKQQLDTESDPERQSSNCEAEAEAEARKSELEKTSQAMRHERQGQRPGSTHCGAARSKPWRPSLQSISEGGL